MTWQDGLTAALILVLAVAAGAVIHAILFAIARRLALRGEGEVGDRLVEYVRRPAGLILPLIAIQLFFPLLTAYLPPPLFMALRHALGLGLIAGVAWLVIAASHVIDDALGVRYRLDVRDNLAARRIHTQARLLRRTITVLIIILTIGVMLMTFPQVRELGASVLASAGLAGIVVGFAARPVLQNLIAGVQIAIAQPIRIDDVVIVEGEWGRIEEITATYVVVRIWDQRRLIVPLNYFIEHTFQNWTRTDAEILGTVFLFVDYTVPVEEVRQELHRLLEENDKWDRRAWGLVVTDATDRAVQLRALMSAADAGTAWDLRCEVREQLIAYLQERHPDGLPRIRAEVESTAG
ncbi:MAG: mechanosensitive ion channel family protein [Gemmatimonadetes bacterium]|nr:mechanosensitive ion channel family protein [Gemmatimonadota bacterium]